MRKKAEMKSVLVTLAAGLILSLGTSAAAQPPTCGTAVLQNVEVVTGRVPQASITSVRGQNDKPSDRNVNAMTTPSERQTKSYLVTVRLNDVVYTGQSSANWFWNYAPTRLVINDPVEICVAKNTLRLRRPDGKDYKTKIVRVVRDVAR